MAVEGFSGIWGLNPSYPLTSDDISQGDDHIRGIKQSMRATWPDISATVAVTDVEFNYLQDLDRNVAQGFNNLSSSLASLRSYGSMYFTGASTEFSASTSLSIFTGFVSTGLSSGTTLKTASGAIAVSTAGDYDVQATLCISSSAAAELTVALYVNDTDSNYHSSTLIPAKGRSGVTVGGQVAMVVDDEIRVRLMVTTSTLITPKDGQIRLRKLN